MTGAGQGGGPRWFTSSRSGGGDCVEVAFVGHEVWVRDSKNPDGPKLTFAREAWRDLVGNPPERPAAR